MTANKVPHDDVTKSANGKEWLLRRIDIRGLGALQDQAGCNQGGQAARWVARVRHPRRMEGGLSVFLPRGVGSEADTSILVRPLLPCNKFSSGQIAGAPCRILPIFPSSSRRRGLLTSMP